jgi:hypothetical protein
MRPTPGSRLVLTVAALVVPLAAAGVLTPPRSAAAPIQGDPIAADPIPTVPIPTDRQEPPDPLPDAGGINGATAGHGGNAADGGNGEKGGNGESAGGEPAAAQRFLLVSADRQSVDVPLGKLIAEGRVEARFDGWLLLADRVEVLESTRTVYASGRIRLIRGDQKLQAGRLRYSELEGTGELEDVYGVIDRETLERQIATAGSAADPGDAADGMADADADRDFACPELESDPRRRPLRELLPPRRLALPTLPAPAGCPGADAGARPRPLRELLTDVAMGPPAPGDAAAGAGADELPPPQSPPPAAELDSAADGIPQRVQDVRFRQGLNASIRFDLLDVNELQGNEDDPEASGGSPTGPSVLRRPKPQAGRLNRLRFQASSVRVRGNRWTAREIAFTNDPFTPARSWLIGYGVEALLEEDGVTRIRAQRTRILLSNRLALRGINNATLGEEGLQLSIDADRRDRDGLYLGYNLPALELGEKGRLELQPQFMLQRAIEGRTDSYTKPGGNLAGPRVSRNIRLGDVFGLAALLDAPIDRFRLRAVADLSTLNPDNIRAGTRSRASLDTPIPLPGHDTARAGAFGSYRERVFNGSLGRQTVITSYGAQLGGSLTFNRQDGDPIDRSRPTPFLAPVRLDWSAISGSYRAELFNTDTLDTQWRTRLNANLSSSLQLWEAPLDPERRQPAALPYSPVPIRPGLALDFGLVGTGAFYQDGDRQNTLTLYGGPAVTLGRFREPWFDYTQLTVLVGGTLRDGLSPYSFDRAVDLRTISFRAAQQLYGPLVLEGGATVNIDSRSRFSGDVSNSYVELKLLQRSYELGIFYSPYQGSAGIRVQLNDFSFSGSGTPFVPRPGVPGEPAVSESR